MVVIRFDECMPQIAVRRITHLTQRLQAGIDGFTKFCGDYQICHRQFYRVLAVLRQTNGLVTVDFQHRIRLTDFSAFQRYPLTLADRNAIQRRTLRQVFLKHQTEFLLLQCLISSFLNLRPQLRIFNFRNQIT